MFTTRSGILYEGDCLSIMPSLKSESVDLVFADPPFNLGKSYSSRIDDALGERHALGVAQLRVGLRLAMAVAADLRRLIPF